MLLALQMIVLIIVKVYIKVNIYNYNYSYHYLHIRSYYSQNKNEVIAMHVDYKLIGGRIKERRKARGMTQEQLAEALSVTVGYVSQMERGVTRSIWKCSRQSHSR